MRTTPLTECLKNWPVRPNRRTSANRRSSESLNAAGERAASIITRAIENDPQTEVKKQAVFALSQLLRDESVAKLIDIARRKKNREVQKQAFVRLGQSDDPRALSFFEEVLAR